MVSCGHLCTVLTPTYPDSALIRSKRHAHSHLAARESLLWEEGPSTVSRNLVEVLLDTRELLLEIQRQFLLGLELLHLLETILEFLPLLDQGRAELAGFFHASFGVGKVCF